MCSTEFVDKSMNQDVNGDEGPSSRVLAESDRKALKPSHRQEPTEPVAPLTCDSRESTESIRHDGLEREKTRKKKKQL